MNRLTPPSIKKVFAGALAAFYLTSSVALTYAQESNIWADRRRHPDPPMDTRLAALPASMRGVGPSDLLRQIPALNRPLAAIGQPLTSSTASRLPRQVAPFIDAIPLNQASIHEIYLPPTVGPAGPLVVLIEDVHLNKEAQLNIAGVLASLCDKAVEEAPGAPFVVGVEAAFGPFDFKPFRVFADKAAAKAVAAAFLDANKIAAPSYVGITAARDLAGFAGVDDEAHYRANVEAYRTASAVRPRVAEALAKSRIALAGEKARALNPDLARFDGLRSAYHNGGMGLGDYVSALSRFNGAKEDGSADLDLVTEQFLDAFKIEKSLDFSRVERERTQIVEKLASKLTTAELRELLTEGLAYRAGRLGFADFYRGIKSLIDRHGISLASTPAFDQYLRYVLLSDGIKAEKLFEAVQRQENALVERLSRTDQERELMARSERMDLVGKLITFALTPDEWSEYKQIREPRPELEAFESFYKEADVRSERFVSNVLSRMKTGAPVGALVIGGFHAPQVSALLRKQGVAYAVLQPKITK
ncbi:MAG: hypothetical protein JO102_03225, partial [Elusimicrobia bacterium]|nr:hypothetical protein [Elusimicrobiota bacterium]